MGYQESYVRVKKSKNFDDLTNHIKEIGKEFYGNNCCEPVEIITLKKDIKGNLDYMMHPNKKYSFKAGEKFIYFVGERFLQRSPNRLLNNTPLKNVEIYATECFPSDNIFDKNNIEIIEEHTRWENDYAIHENFKWE